MMDLTALKSQVDLLALAQNHTSLRRVSASGGGEWAGPCPFCGGTDRFHLQPFRPAGGIWLCRRCSDGKWQDVIAFGQKLWPGLNFQAVCTRLAGGTPPAGGPVAGAHAAPRRPIPPAYTPPPQEWQAAAKQAVAECAAALWTPSAAHARDYLHRRGFEESTLRFWQVGYSTGQRVGDLWIGPGLLLPCVVAREIWYLKIALLPGQRVRCTACGQPAPARQPCPACGAANKYRGVRGNRPAAIFGADDLPGAPLALFVEGEFDALIAWQQLRDVTAVCTLGSAATRPDLATWGPYLASVPLLLAAYDADQAGQAGLQALKGIAPAVRPCPSPPGAKDLNDYYLQGGDLWAWFKSILPQENET